MSIHPDVKLTDWLPYPRAVALELNALYPQCSWGTYPGHDPNENRAADAMIPRYTTAAGRALGDELAAWCWANRKRYNLWYQIWNGRIRSRTDGEAAGWKRYFAADDPSDSKSHRNHNHLSFYVPVTFTEVWLDRLRPGVTGSASVATLQRFLKLPETGDFGDRELSAVRVFQNAVLGDAPQYADGILGPWQAAELLKQSGQRAVLRPDPSGASAPKPEVPDTEPKPEPPIVVVPPKPEPEYPVPTSGELYLDKLKPGTKDSDSVAYVQHWLEQVLRVELRRTGDYDDATQGAAKAYQRDKLGDAEQYVDGVLGKLQTIALAKAAGASVTIYADSAKGGQVWPEPAAPAKPPTPTRPGVVTLRLKAWNGSAAGRTLIQGVLWDETNRCYFIHQADDVPGQEEQSIVVRRHDEDGTYRGYVTLPGAGHGSSMGLEPVRRGVVRLWVGHASRGVGFVTYTIGNPDTPFTSVAKLPMGDVTVSPEADLLCVRAGTLYRGYRLSDAVQGKATKLWECRIPNWLVRFQGHLVTGTQLYIHRDAKTKGASELRAYSHKGVRRQRWDTNPMGDEAEGAMLKDGWLWAVSRTGGNTPNRVVTATPLERAR